MSWKVKTSLLLTMIAVAAFVIKREQPNEEYKKIIATCDLNEQVLEQPELHYLYGIPSEQYDVIKDKIKRNQFVADILVTHGISHPKVLDITSRFKNIFDVRRFQVGKPYTLFMSRDSARADYFVYAINRVDYVVYDFLEDTVFRGQKETYVVRKEVTGIIESSLYETIKKANANPLLTYELADIYAWVIDFYRLQKGDKFKVIYTENFVEDKSAGIDQIMSAVFNHFGNDFYAFYFHPDSLEVGNYFDENAGSLRKAFLKAPLKFSRISSRYSTRRFHPVLKRYKSHLGVDYAAPTGTPILAVGDGVVIEARYKKNNGNYVKIKHNSTYSTQYLHMSKIGKGIKVGKKVLQGQTIGYVGSTGLATGPHVCYRFWKHGSQVNPLKIKIPPSKPIEKKYLEEYKKVVVEMKKELDAIAYTKDSLPL